MNPMLWFLVAVFGLNALSMVASTGKVRKPISPEIAVVALSVDTLIIAAIFIFS